MSYKNAELSAQRALEAVALKNGVSAQAVRREIESAIAMAGENPDPEARAFWNSVPRKGKVPTPEEVIAYIAAAGYEITH